MEYKSWLDRLHAGQDEIETVIKQLKYLAGNFYETGNPKVADKLNGMAFDLEFGLDDINKAIDKNLTDGYNQACEGTGKILSALVKASDKESK
jgi:hypothetical protein